MKKQKNLFLDSGAFSAWSKGAEINIDEYINFIKENEKYITHYAVLDDITNPQQTWENQRYMESKGLNPIPTFHYGEDIKWLQRYIKKYKYIALGGMVPIGNKELVLWLDNLFSKYICDKQGNPKLKVHGFGLTALPLLIRYPWYSVDSTSWLMTGTFGSVLVPKLRNEDFDYSVIPYKIIVSDKSPGIKKEGKHFNTFSSAEKKILSEYFEKKGFTFEELSSNYKKRHEINIEYFIDLEKALPKWPWKFKLKNQSKGFEL